MKKLTFTKSEVQSYLEDVIQSGLATESEQHAYENLMWNNKMDLATYKSVVSDMKEQWYEKF